MSTRSCTEVRADLSAYLDGDLDAGQAEATRAHLEHCAACRSELGQLRLTVDALRRLPELPPPAAILDGIRSRMQPEPWYRRLLGARQWPLGVPAGALATLLVIVGISLYQRQLPKSLTQGPLPPPPPPERVGEPPRAGVPAPATRTAVADRKVAPPPPPAVRVDLRAKGVLDSAAPRGASPEGRTTSAEPAAFAGAGRKDRPLAAPATPAGPAVPDDLPAVEPRIGHVSSPSRPEPRAAAPTDARRQVLQPVEAPPAASRSLVPRPEPESAVAVGAYPAELGSSGNLGGAAIEELDEAAGALSPAPSDKKESPAGRAQFAKETESASTRVRMVCLLLPEGDSVESLVRLLRGEGAGDIVVRELLPREVREAFAPHRGRAATLPEPARGWALTANVPAGSLAPLIDACARATGLRILERPAERPAGDQAAGLELRITVLR